MKLFEALALRKALQGQLAQLISIRNSTYEHLMDEEPEFNFKSLTAQIKEKVNTVTVLKLAIMKANMETELSNGLTLYANIIELANIRSAIDQLGDLVQVGRRGYLIDRRRTTQEVKVVKQMAPEELLKMVDNYDSKRRLLDAMIQEANHTVEISWPVK